MNLEDTIGAISTPPGRGGIGIVRISGEKALSVADQLFQGDVVLSQAKSHTVHYGTCISAQTGEVIDEVLCIVMKKPHTYTREDIVEFQTHGSMLLMQEVLDAAFKLGVRPAEPGEFTLRAYLNGRLDLTKAEAVADLVNAETGWARKSAITHLLGKFQEKIKEIRQRLVNLFALYEAEIDFYEEDIKLVNRQHSIQELKEICDQVQQLTRTYTFGRLVREGARIGIFGLVNVGKSSVFNALLGTDRAIVHKEPGTTRDLVEGESTIGEILCRLTDTAGFREGVSEVEAEGLRRTTFAMRETDLALMVLDTSNPNHDEEEKVYKEIVTQIGSAEKIIIVFNKIDLLPKHFIIRNHRFLDSSLSVSVSAVQGSGIDDLKEMVKNVLVEWGTSQTTGLIITNSRHYYVLVAVKKLIDRLIKNVEETHSGELLALDFREVINHLGEITGETIGDAILHQIFSKFCIGK